MFDGISKGYLSFEPVPDGHATKAELYSEKLERMYASLQVSFFGQPKN